MSEKRSSIGSGRILAAMIVALIMALMVFAGAAVAGPDAAGADSKAELVRAHTGFHRALPDAGQLLQVRLGYPRDAKLLILNADDLAVSHSEDVASFAALEQKLVTSATVMVPCPWFTEVAAYAKAHPDADLGLHLTFTSEWQTYRWGPVSPRALVPSLIGPDGYFYSSAQEFAKHAKLAEVETELRAQIE